MPDSPIHDLNSASRVTYGDLFVLEQDGQAKKLEGQYLLNYVYERLDVAHGATSFLPITTEPTAYTTPTHDFTPAYRIELADVTSEARVNSVLVGDQLRYDAYLYPVGYVDTVYAFLGPRVSIKGEQGTPGADGKDGHSPIITAQRMQSRLNVYSDDTYIGHVEDGRSGTNGQDGITPTIGANGNWYLGTTDTGKPSRGVQGVPGPKGDPGEVDLSAYRTAAAQDAIDAAKAPATNPTLSGTTTLTGPMVISSAMYGTTLPTTGVEGQLFFLLEAT